MSEKKHYSFAQLARSKAMTGWGVETSTQSEALKGTSSPAASAEGALLELVRRLNQAILAWKDDDDLDEDDDDGDGKRPKGACPFPNVQIGDMLYRANMLEAPPSRYLVVHKDDEGYVRIVSSDHKPDDGDLNIWLGWGSSDHLTSAKDAVRRGALQVLEWYGPRCRQARAVLGALNKDLPYEHLIGESGRTLNPVSPTQDTGSNP